MAFFEHRMNEDLTYGARGGPVYSTSRAYSQSGYRIANRMWTYPLHRYDISHCLKKQSDFAEIQRFFYNVYGGADGFRFKDWMDFRHNDLGATAPLTLISGSNYQTVKSYPTGSRALVRPIKKLVSGVQIFRTRSGSTTNITATDAMINLNTGVIGINNHVSGDTYSWTGQFDVPAAFVSDEWMPEITNYSQGELMIASGQILIEEIRV